MRKKLALLVLIFLFFGLAAGTAGYRLVFSPNTPDFEGERTVKIPRGSSFSSVVDSLTTAGILASGTSFTWMADLTGWGNQIKAGHYSFTSGASNHDLLSTLRRGLQTPVHLTIPPGTSRPIVVANVVAREMAFTPEDFMKALYDPALAAELETDTTHLYSYMLPETYFFYWLTDAPTVVRKVKQTTDELIRETLQGSAAPQNLTSDEVLRMAGIVEWESHHEPERARVAGVYLNRLRDGWPLQADPTVQYAILQREGQKRRLFFKDYDIKHPFNTYTYRGLPPGPITNPTPSSIRATLKPEAHTYFYFVAKGDGTHAFSRTLAEHNRNAQIFYRLMQEQRKKEQGR